MKAIGYIRVSTEDQAREGVSLGNQEANLCTTENYSVAPAYSMTQMKATDENPYPKSFEEFLDWFQCAEDCERYLEWIRWPEGFACPRCAEQKFWRTERGAIARSPSTTPNASWARGSSIRTPSSSPSIMPSEAT